MIQRARLPHVPRLSIGYLLFLTAVTAGSLSLIRFLVGSPGRTAEVVNLARIVPGMLVFSWTASASLMIGWHAARRTLWPLEPGEWAVLAGFVTTGLFLAQIFAVHFAIEFVITDNHTQHRTPNPVGLGERLQWLNLMQVVSVAIMTIPYAAAAVAQRRRRWWLACFTLLAGTLAGSSIVSLSVLLSDTWNFQLLRAWSAVEIVLVLAAVLLIPIAFVMDRRRREPRHWLHWSGVALTELFLALLLAGLAMGG